MKLLDNLIKNLIFAMNFNDDVPEHILEKIFKHNKNKDANIAHELETLTSIEDFNAEVNRKLGKQKIVEEALFSSIIGYSDIKNCL